MSLEDKDHSLIKTLKEDYSKGDLPRRDFLRFTTLLGMTAASAYAFVGKIENLRFIPTAAKAAIPKGGTLKISHRVLKVSSPHTFSWILDSNIFRQVGDYMTQTGQDNVTRPALIRKWKPSKDLRTWTFKVRDVKWRKGEKLTAEHLAWNIRQCLDPRVGSSVVGLMKGYMLKEIDSGKKDKNGNAVMTTELWDANAIEVLDDKTLRLNLKEPQVAVPEHMFHYPFAILDPSENGKFGVGSNGTGAFDLVEHAVSRIAIFEARKEKNWAGGPYLDKLVFIDLGDKPSAETAAIKSKQVQGIYEGNVEQLPLYKKMSHVNIYKAVTANTGIARVQVDRPEFKDPRVRKAMRLSIDAVAVQKIAYGPLGVPAESHHVAPVHPDYFKLPLVKRDIAGAKKLLAEAGYPNGIDLEIAGKPDPSWEIRAIEALVDQWREAGIRVKINQLPSAKFWEVWDKVPFGFTQWAHRPLGFMVLGLAYRSGVPWNESHYNNPKFDRALTKAEGTVNIKKRSKIIGELEKIMQEDGPIVQPIWRTVYTVYDKKVKGYAVHPTYYVFGTQIGVES